MYLLNSGSSNTGTELRRPLAASCSLPRKREPPPEETLAVARAGSGCSGLHFGTAASMSVGPLGLSCLPPKDESMSM